MSPVKANTPAKGGKTPSKAKTSSFTPPKTRRRSMKPPTPKAATPKAATPEQKNKAPALSKKTPQKPEQAKTPAKGKTPQKKTPAPPKDQSAKKTPAPAVAVLERRAKKTPADQELTDKKTLFLKGLPRSCTAEKLRAAASDVVDVRMRHARWQRKGSNLFAFVEFKTEAAAEKNFASLSKFEGNKVFVDFVGKKAKVEKRKRSEVPTVGAPTKLFARGLAFSKEDEEKLKQMTKCDKIDVPVKNGHRRGFAFLHFKSEADAAKALKAHANANVNGQKLELKPAQIHVYETEKKSDGPKAKKAKIDNGKKAEKKSVTEEDEDESDEDFEVDDDMLEDADDLDDDDDEEEEDDDEGDEDDDDDDE